MNENNVLRFAFITGNGQATTFAANLYKLICVSIYDSGDFMSSFDISEYIKNNYSLDFLEMEIEEVLHNSKYSASFIESKNSQNTLFCLSPKKKQALSELEPSFSLDKYIQEYIDVKKISIEKDYVYNKISEFLYKTFLINKSVVLELIKGSYSNAIAQVEMSNDEKALINDFLNWDNKEKDVYIFNTISYCVEYCQLTIKKNSNSFNSAFSGKCFYLDSNVIFRLIGFNNVERKKVISAFVSKCKECGIKIKYTNFTYIEIISTIEKYVDVLSKENNGRRPLSITNYENFVPNYNNIELLKLYLEWAQIPGNVYSDYVSFKKYLISKVDAAIIGFKNETFIDNKIINKDEYDLYSGKLEQFKTDHGSNFTNASIGVDVNNIMHVWELRKKESGNNFFNINNYFISTDSRLCNWSSELIPGSAPICVLPSVWYSLILKFNGRTDDDFKAFNLFINMRFKSAESEVETKKAEIFTYVNSLDETTDIKNRILENIHTEMVCTGSISTDSPAEIVEREQNAIIQGEIELFKKENGKPYIKEGEFNVINQLAEKKGEKKFKRYQRIIKFKNVAKIIMGIILIGAIICFFATNKIDSVSKLITNREADVSLIIDCIVVLIQIIGFLVINPINDFLETKTLSAIIDKEKGKLINELGQK